MLSCGVQCINCDYPIHLDTYSGCSHACKYCYVKQRHSIDTIKPLSSVKGVRDFINGKRNNETKWCDWNIPIHWGANSDPFQECEREYKKSLEVLRIFAETRYPFIISTKNPVLLTEEPYLSLLHQCDCVIQISMACSKYDKLETGAPTFKERLQAAQILSGNVQRVITRIQPYFTDAHKDIISELPNFKRAGVQGVIVEGYKSAKKLPGMVENGGKLYRYPTEVLAARFKDIKAECHKHGLEFTCVENLLDHLSDSLTCCGTANLPTFKPTPYTVPRIAYDGGNAKPTESMKQYGTTRPFKCIKQNQEWALMLKDKTYADMIDYYADMYYYILQNARDMWGE